MIRIRVHSSVKFASGLGLRPWTQALALTSNPGFPGAWPQAKKFSLCSGVAFLFSGFAIFQVFRFSDVSRFPVFPWPQALALPASSGLWPWPKALATNSGVLGVCVSCVPVSPWPWPGALASGLGLKPWPRALASGLGLRP